MTFLPRPFHSARGVLVAVFLFAAPAHAQLKRAAPTSMSDAEFWQFFTSMSETGGSFPSENFVSNELTFEHVIPTLKRTVTPDGVYLGVGPEQNFTYIANLKPRMAVIFDIRRQNAMAHLMYKAIFELSPTRADFVSRLFGRPLATRLGTNVKVDDLFAIATAAPPSDSAASATEKAVFAQLVNKHHFVLTPGDSAGIEHLLEVFHEAGPDINYGYSSYRSNRGNFRSNYPTYAELQVLTAADSVQMAFLATEENYRAVRDLHLRNMIVPVVGDFAGPKAIRAVGEYLSQRSMKVAAFYLSNVEQYLFQNGVADAFYANVATLPIDSTSMFIRSVPGGGFGQSGFSFGGGSVSLGGMSGAGALGSGGSVSLTIVDNSGVKTMQVIQDSAGHMVTRNYRDSAGVMVARPDSQGSSAKQDSVMTAQANALAARQDSLIARLVPGAPAMPFAISRPGAQVRAFGGSLTSGIAPIGATVTKAKSGQLLSYRDIIDMTRISGWK